MLEEPDWPSLVAVTLALPAPAAVTNPVPFTVATAVFALVQVMVRPVSTVPFASLRVAVSCCVLPNETVADAGATVTVATGAAVIVTAALPLREPPVCVAVTA